MVYTSVENIHKVIDPLFMNDLKAELESIKSERAIAIRRAKATAFQDKLGSLSFLDPACGSGNFLTETFLSLRKLENEAIVVGERLKPGEVLLNLDGMVKVSIKQFHGIEINDFAVSVAKTAMWISEAKMLNETANILHAPPKYLPLHDYDGIVEGNALRMDWGNLVAAKNAENAKIGFDYIMGNPPFVGHQYRSREQASDMDSIYADWKDTNYGKLDYVCSWYKKAVDFIIATKNTKSTKCAFVSTNSICQGESVAAMWKPLFDRAHVVIDFAHRTFRWDSEATEKAHVHCVIVGFHVAGKETPTVEALATAPQLRAPNPKERRSVSEASDKSELTKTIYDGDRVISAAHINGYLVDAPDVFIENRGGVKTPGLSAMSKGSQPTDGGNLILSATERDAILAKWPDAASFVLRYIGADDYINNIFRYCLWLDGVEPSRYRHIPAIMERLTRVSEMRRGSPTKSVQKAAETPMLFTQIRQPKTEYLVVPEVSSERRRYIPIGMVKPDVIVSNMLYVIPDANPYILGVLSSSIHMSWMRVVAGRLKSDYRYTPAVYNNFPWPTSADSAPLGTRFARLGSLQIASPACAAVTRLCVEKISQTAQSILDARARYPESSLADLYDPLTMPPDLRAAHEANDRAVLAAYGLKTDTPEPEIVAHLFKLYAAMTASTKESCQ